MARTTTALVQEWLSSDRITVASDDLLEQVDEYVISTLEGTYDTSGWADATDTPDLVQQVIALLDAEYLLRKFYSDQDDDIPYADTLHTMAQGMLDSMLLGNLDLTIGTIVLTATEMTTAITAAGPTHFPGETERLDTTETAAHTIAFEMGTVF